MPSWSLRRRSRVAERSDGQQLALYAGELADVIEASLAGWVRRSVQRRCRDAGVAADDALDRATVTAGDRCRDEFAPEVRALLMADIDEQTTTPLSLLRAAVRYPTEVLAAAGVAPVERDEFARRAFPADIYALAPANFADVDEQLAEPGLVWGAAKAHVHLTRRRDEGLR